jgi:hypothetical protein
MRITRRWRGCGALGLALVALGGCQTYYGGMTLPSPHYLKHSPQYFPQDPTFPLQRERDSMLDPDGALRRGVAGPLPPPPGAPVLPPPPPAPAVQPNPGGVEAGAPGTGR